MILVCFCVWKVIVGAGGIPKKPIIGWGCVCVTSQERERGGIEKRISQTISRVLYLPPKWRCLSFIRTCRCRQALSFYPPTLNRRGHPGATCLRFIGRATLNALVYMNFQLPMCTARMSPHGWWALTPPSHPYPKCASCA